MKPKSYITLFVLYFMHNFIYSQVDINYLKAGTHHLPDASVSLSQDYFLGPAYAEFFNQAIHFKLENKRKMVFQGNYSFFINKKLDFQRHLSEKANNYSTELPTSRKWGLHYTHILITNEKKFTNLSKKFKDNVFASVDLPAPRLKTFGVSIGTEHLKTTLRSYGSYSQLAPFYANQNTSATLTETDFSPVYKNEILNIGIRTNSYKYMITDLSSDYFNGKYKKIKKNTFKVDLLFRYNASISDISTFQQNSLNTSNIKSKVGFLVGFEGEHFIVKDNIGYFYGLEGGVYPNESSITYSIYLNVKIGVTFGFKVPFINQLEEKTEPVQNLDLQFSR